MSFKYNQYITIPEDIENCKKVLGIWSDKKHDRVGSDVIVWVTNGGEQLGWFINKIAGLGVYPGDSLGWTLSTHRKVKALIDDGITPDIYNPGNIKSKERYRLIDKGSYYGLELIEG